MPVKKENKLKVDFIHQMPIVWLNKIPGNKLGYTYKVALYIWFIKGLKKNHEHLLVTHREINFYFPVPRWALTRALKELEEYRMITVNRSVGKSPTVTVLCEEYYEQYPVKKH